MTKIYADISNGMRSPINYVKVKDRKFIDEVQYKDLEQKLADQDKYINALKKDVDNNYELYQAALEKLASLSAKSGEGFEEWVQRYGKDQDIMVWLVDQREDFLNAWQASRLPLLAKIEEHKHHFDVLKDDWHRLENQNKETDKKLVSAVKVLKSARIDIETMAFQISNHLRDRHHNALAELSEQGAFVRVAIIDKAIKHISAQE